MDIKELDKLWNRANRGNEHEARYVLMDLIQMLKFEQRQKDRLRVELQRKIDESLVPPEGYPGDRRYDPGNGWKTASEEVVRNKTTLKKLVKSMKKKSKRSKIPKAGFPHDNNPRN